MNIQPTIETATIYAIQAAKSLKEYALWATHTIEINFNNHAVPAIRQLWTVIQANIAHAKIFILTAPGKIFTVAGGLFLIGMLSFKISDHKAYEDSPFAKGVWKASGIALFALATVVTSAGIATLIV